MSLIRSLSRSLSLPADPSDAAIHRQLCEKVIPWSRSPFDEKITDAEAEKATLLLEAEEDDCNAEAVPGWIELFYDLAWTMSFSGLTGGTPIRDSRAIQSYIVFFALAWWGWVQQVTYDTRYYTNDHFHRVILVLQFLAFVSLASYTEGFDIYRGIIHDGNIDLPEQRLENRYLTRAFQAIAIVFGVTRFMLAAQYIRVAMYKHSTRTKNLLVIIVSLIRSGLLFFISFFVILAAPQDGGKDARGAVAHIAKFVLWFTAFAIEIGVYLHSDSPYGLLRVAPMSERLGGLTTIVLGESLNGLIDPLTVVAKSIGFGMQSAFQIITVALAVFLIFVLYFASFDLKAGVTSLRQKLIVFGHFPLFICIVLLIEGMKGVMTLITFLAPLMTFITRLKNRKSVGDLEILYGDLGLNFRETYSVIQQLDHGPPDTQLAKDTELIRLAVSGIIAIAEQFGVFSDETKDKWNDYVLSQEPNQALLDMQAPRFPGGDPPLFSSLLQDLIYEVSSPLRYISIVAGCYLFCLMLLMLLRASHFSKYFWSSIGSRAAIAVIVLSTALLQRGDRLLEFAVKGGFLPLIVGLLAFQYLLDYGIYWLMARGFKRRGLLEKALAPHVHVKTV